MEFAYKMIGGDGKEYGPVPQQEMLAWVQQGRVVAATQVQRSDQNAWQPAGAFPELGLASGTEAPAPGAASDLPPLAAPPAAVPPGTNALTSALEGQLKSGASWFYWIAGLSVVNSVATLSGSGWGFVVGLGITQIFDHVAREAGSGAVAIAAVLDFLAAGVFVLFGVFAHKKHTWAFLVGMILYGLDGLIFLLIRSWFSLGFHVFALYCIFKGYQAMRQMKAPG
jgi:hypothetical protein